MNPFITFKDTDNNNEIQYYILQRTFPHYIGLISKIPKQVFVPSVPISNYNLFIVFNGVLMGNFLPSYNNVDKEISIVLEKMAIWFFNERIMKDEKRYKKLKI